MHPWKATKDAGQRLGICTVFNILLWEWHPFILVMNSPAEIIPKNLSSHLLAPMPKALSLLTAKASTALTWRLSSLRFSVGTKVVWEVTSFFLCTQFLVKCPNTWKVFCHGARPHVVLVFTVRAQLHCFCSVALFGTHKAWKAEISVLPNPHPQSWKVYDDFYVSQRGCIHHGVKGKTQPFSNSVP